MPTHTTRQAKGAKSDDRDNVSDNTIVRDETTTSNNDSDIAEFYDRKNHEQTAEDCHNKVAAAQEFSDIDAAVAEFKEMYLRSSSVRRGLLRRVHRRFGTDPFSDDMIDYYLKPGVLQAMSFRFMDSPPELRLHVARYALAAPDFKIPTWQWKKVFALAGGRIGSFANLVEATALTRVSRQLRAELSPLIREVNTFEFGQVCMDKRNHARMWNACELFTRTMPLCKLARLSITFGVYFDVFTVELPALHALIQQLPKTHVKVIAECWSLVSDEIQGYDKVVAFVNYKDKIANKLASHDLDISQRTWRVFPRIFEDELEKVQEALRYELRNWMRLD